MTELKTSWAEAAQKLERAFALYEERAQSYLEEMTKGQPDKCSVARMMKELNMLGQDVAYMLEAGGRLDSKQKQSKAHIDEWIETNKDIYAITQDDIERAELYKTSTGRLTAKPQFRSRFDA